MASRRLRAGEGPACARAVGLAGALSGSAVLLAAGAVLEPSAGAAEPGSAVFGYTGGQQEFTVPAHVCELTVSVDGAQGGSAAASAGGLGGRVSARLAVTAGTVFTFRVGGQGGVTLGGYGGGGTGGAGHGLPGGAGGGGASTLAESGEVLVIAAGGGGNAQILPSAGTGGAGGGGGGGGAIGGGGGGGGGGADVGAAGGGGSSSGPAGSTYATGVRAGNGQVDFAYTPGEGCTSPSPTGSTPTRTTSPAPTHSQTVGPTPTDHRLPETGTTTVLPAALASAVLTGLGLAVLVLIALRRRTTGHDRRH